MQHETSRLVRPVFRAPTVAATLPPSHPHQRPAVRASSVTSNEVTYTIGGACPADFNCSGAISVQDIFDFLAAYFSADPRADFNASGTISVQDIFDFLAAYFAGC